MARYVLKALTGPVKGKIFLIKDGLKIGRSSGDIILKDKMVSNLHAEIRIYASGKIMIIDKDSKNKIIINKQATIKSILEKGSKFEIGQTEFELDFIKAPEEILSEFIKKKSKDIKDQALSLKPFFQVIEVLFSSGLQKGERHCLYYGPRFFGSASVDFPLFEKQAPKKAFVFIPGEMETFFVTDHPEIVRFNGKKIQKSKISSGDKILIGNTILKLTLK